VQNLAERAVLIPVGAALSARDRVVEVVDSLNVNTTRKQLNRFERRGNTARTRVERELRQRRTRVERTFKRNEARIERDVKSAQRNLNRNGSVLNQVSANVDLVSAQVENAVQTGVTAGAKFVAEATDRVASTVS